MLTVHCKNGVNLTYVGNITLELCEPFLCIQAEGVIPERDGLHVWSSRTYDKLFLTDIDSIRAYPKAFFRYDYLKIGDMERCPYPWGTEACGDWCVKDDDRMSLLALDRYADYLYGKNQKRESS